MHNLRWHLELRRGLANIQLNFVMSLMVTCMCMCTWMNQIKFCVRLKIHATKTKAWKIGKKNVAGFIANKNNKRDRE